MKAYLVSIVMTCICVSVLAQPEFNKRLQGQWTCVEFIEDGKQMPNESIKDVTLTIFEDNYLVFMGDFVVPFKIQTQAGSNMVLTATSGINRNKTFPGKFSLTNNDELIVAYGSETPSLEKSTASTGRYIRWKRVGSLRQGAPVKTYSNSVSMNLQLILPATFIMGANPDEDGRQDEIQHRVTISKPFYLAETEVTVAQFRQFITESGRQQFAATSERKTGAYVTDAERGRSLGLAAARGGVSTAKNGINSWDSAATWRTPGFPQTEKHPVVFVSWNDANEFCRWLSQKEGKKYRLPTEAEWELGARAGTLEQYWWGNDVNDRRVLANLADVSYARKFPHRNFGLVINDNFIYTAPVATFKPNANGLYDVTGNVFEWVSDFWAPFTNDPLVNPAGPQLGRYRVAKGGAWASNPNDCRLAFRFREDPDLRFAGIGFRVLLEVE